MLRKIALLLLALIVAFVGGAFLLPRHPHVERAIEIAAPPATIMPHITDFKRFNEWSPWHGRDPKTKYTFSGPASGKGAKMAWESERSDVGSGTQEILEVEDGKRVRVKLDFGSKGQAVASYRLEPVAGGKTRVVWAFDGDMGNNPIGRWMGLMLDRWIGPDYEAGLAKLKTLAEKA